MTDISKFIPDLSAIDQDYYRSKYHEPISDLPSKKNKEFAEALKEILG